MSRAPLLALAFVVSWGCATGPSDPHTLDGAIADSGPRDAGVTTDAGPPDAGPPVDGGEPLPERCNSEFAYFMDEFGREAYCIFVAMSGDDMTGDGTVDLPFRTISHGIEVAIAQGVASGRVHAVAVSRGRYEERVVLANGISVYGQFDAEDMWSRGTDNETIIDTREVVDGRIEGVVAESITAPTVIEGFTVNAGSALVTTRDIDVYGVRVASSEPVLPELGGLVLRHLEVEAGHGAAGTDGVEGAVGETGVIGVNGSNGHKMNGDVVPGGMGSAAICETVTIEDSRGGVGGVGGGDDALGCGTYREDAAAGEAPSGLASCAGGTAGDACSCVSPIDYDGEPGGPGNLCSMDPADPGEAALSSAVHGEVAGGFWVPTSPGDGTPGAHGVGGSGGGGGGSGCDGTGYGTTGGGGGGGGSGGCGGHAGTGGHSGGSSFALFVSGSTISAPSCTFQSRNGGTGGAGSQGGAGGPGGEGGPGGTGGYAGGLGGAGQAGGSGGAGAGGVGGSSIGAFVCDGDVVDLDLMQVASGLEGAAGPASADGAPGIDGFASRVFFGCDF